MLPSQMCRLFQRRELPCIPARQILTDFIKTLQSLLVSFHWAHAQGGSLAPPHLEVGLPRGALAQIRGKGLLPDSQWVCGWSEPEPWSVIQHRVKKNKHHLQQDELHRWLADGFLGIWALGKEHCTDAKKREAEKALTSVSQLLPAPTLLHQFVPWRFCRASVPLWNCSALLKTNWIVPTSSLSGQHYHHLRWPFSNCSFISKFVAIYGVINTWIKASEK